MKIPTEIHDHRTDATEDKLAEAKERHGVNWSRKPDVRCTRAPPRTPGVRPPMDASKVS